jgi:hypothetical protein
MQACRFEQVNGAHQAAGRDLVVPDRQSVRVIAKAARLLHRQDDGVGGDRARQVVADRDVSLLGALQIEHAEIHGLTRFVEHEKHRRRREERGRPTIHPPRQPAERHPPSASGQHQ